MSILATSESTGGLLGVVEGDEPAATATPLHRHAAAEAWYILRGSYTFHVDGEWHDVGVGDFIFVPGELAHGFVVGAEGGRKLTLILPAGMEGYFRDWARALRTQSATAPLGGEIASRYQATILGPLPER